MKTPGSGRQKGTPNKKNQLIEDKARELGVDPFEILIRFAGGDWEGLGYENSVYHTEKPDGSVKMGYVITPEMRLKAAAEACQYLLPKKKAVELSNTDGQAFEVKIMDYLSKPK